MSSLEQLDKIADELRFMMNNMMKSFGTLEESIDKSLDTLEITVNNIKITTDRLSRDVEQLKKQSSR